MNINVFMFKYACIYIHIIYYSVYLIYLFNLTTLYTRLFKFHLMFYTAPFVTGLLLVPNGLNDEKKSSKS